MAIVDVFLYPGATPQNDVILADPTQIRVTTVYVAPFAWNSFWKIVEAWQPGPPLLWRGPYLPQTHVDDPPFGYKSPIWLGLPKWQERSLTPLIGGHNIFPPTDVPWRLVDPSLWTLLRAWEPGPPYKHWEVRQVAIFRAPDDPPFGVKTAFGPILTAWQPGPQLPWHSNPVPQEFVATTNDPPFGLKTPIWPIITAWQPGPPRPWRRDSYAILETVLVPDDPPFGIPNPALWTLLAAWKPGPHRLHWGTFAPVIATDVPVNDPPFGLRNPLWPIITSWQPGPPQGQRGFLFPPVLPAVDEPPYGIPNPSFQRILDAWVPGSLLPRKAAVSPEIFAQSLQRLTALSLTLSPELSQTITWSGNVLPIQILPQAPIDPPPGGKGVCFVFTGGVVSLYIWDGAIWRASA